VVDLNMVQKICSKASQTEHGIPNISSSSSKAAENMEDSKQDFSGSSMEKIKECYADTIQDDLLNQREGRTEETRFKNEGPKEKENQEVLLKSRLEAAQENLSASKRFKIEYGDSHDYIKSTFSEGQSSDETICRKRKLNEDEDDLLTIKRFKLSDIIDATETETTTEQKSSSSHSAMILEPVEDDWYHIGQCLELKESVLTKIKEMTRVDSRLTHVLETWCHEKDRTITELKDSLKRMDRDDILEVKNSKEVQTQIETENKEKQTTQITLDKEIQFNYLVPSQG
uniref:Death domain-containing protein n=1 Tax=Amphimedon queenslandica TaxID=400682 RepID=A0A1X7SY50_AMPQE